MDSLWLCSQGLWSPNASDEATSEEYTAREVVRRVRSSTPRRFAARASSSRSTSWPREDSLVSVHARWTLARDPVLQGGRSQGGLSAVVRGRSRRLAAADHKALDPARGDTRESYTSDRDGAAHECGPVEELQWRVRCVGGACGGGLRSY